MKEKSVIAILFLLMAGFQSATAQKMIVIQTDGKATEYSVTSVKEVVFVEDASSDENTHGTTDGHDWVDLGLPSGTLWATCNVGASSPEAVGGYYAWGETTTKMTYKWSTYKHCRGSATTLTKYCSLSSCGTVDNKKELDPEDDAATANWGKNWQMPSYDQCAELCNTNYTVTEWTTKNGVDGRLITSKTNGNSIFLPAGGRRYDAYLYDSYEGDYWSRTYSEQLDNCSFAYKLIFGSGIIYAGSSYDRSNGALVRPVCVGKAEEAKLVTDIILSDTLLLLKSDSTKTITAIVLPDDADNKVVEWESSDEHVAMVSKDGKVTAYGEGECTIICRATDGSGVYALCSVVVNNHEWVDLGLTSGTLWASHNIGASVPEQPGLYFAWGELEPKEEYTWQTYKFGYPPSKYNAEDMLTILEEQDDAASVLWGHGWRMPTRTDEEEIYEECTWTWEPLNGKEGFRVTGVNGNSIFLPTTGLYDASVMLERQETGGWYWSATSNGNYNACGICFPSTNYLYMWVPNHDRQDGHCIRPVRAKEERKPKLVTEILLSDTLLILKQDNSKLVTATVLPLYADNKVVEWTSSDEMVATVSEEGLVMAIAVGTCTITCRATDGSGMCAECQVMVEAAETHEWVDLGLPSGTLWATCNVGASSPEEYGDYFAWGETEPKTTYSWNTYKWCNGSAKTLTKYCISSSYGYNGFTDTLTELEYEDDAATKSWGSDWQIPSLAQIQELYSISYTTTIWTTQNGVCGYKITSKSNGNSIFLPAAGCRAEPNLIYAGNDGYFWSSSLGQNDHDGAYGLHFGNFGWGWTNWGDRNCGRSVRPVHVQTR